MKKTILFAAASTAALLCSAVAFAQENQTGFVTLDLNWTAGGAPAESELDGDTMKQILERDQQRVKMIQERAKGATLTLDLPQDEEKNDGDAMRQMLERDQQRVKMIQERAKAKAPELKDDAKKDDAATGKAPVAPPDESRMRTISGDQMRQIVERDRARARAMGERVRAAQAEAEAEKYLQEHPVEFTPGKTPAGWLDDLQAALEKGKKENKPVFALFTGSDWCPPCQKLEKNVLLQPAFKAFAEKHLVLLFLDSPRDTKLDEKTQKQNEALSKKFSVEGVPTAIILSADGQKALWSHVGYAPLFLEELQKGVQGLDKDYPETAKAVKDEAEAEAKAKAEAKAAQEKAELEEFERQQKEAQRNAQLNPWGAGRLNRNVQPSEELLRELDKNGPVKGPDVLPHGGPAPLRPSVKLD